VSAKEQDRADQQIKRAIHGRVMVEGQIPNVKGRSATKSLTDWQAAPAAECGQRVLQQASDGHRPDAARNRRDRAGDGLNLGESDIADELGRAVALDPVDADIDHHGARLYSIAAHHLRLADGGDEDFGAPALGR
jgi:hypothetical protein